MKHVTFNCPVCSMPDKAVGDPNQQKNGHSGVWICFACRAHGTYDVTFSVADQPGQHTAP